MLQLQLGTPAYGGTHLARDGSQTWFVSYGASGETVIAQPDEKPRAGVSFAHVVEVVTPSPSRVEPPCPHFGVGRCGGCQLQHVQGSEQRAMKASVVGEQLRRIGGFADPSVRPIRALDSEWAYRAHVTFHIDERGDPSFVSTDHHTLMPIETCHIVHPDLLGILPALRRLHLPSGSRVRVHRADPDAPDALASVAAVLIDERSRLIRPLFGDARLYHQVGGYRFGVRPDGFFQVNAQGAGLLVDAVIDALDGDIYEHALDLFCGVGLFSLPLSEYARYVTGIEIAPEAVEDARANARAANRTNTSFQAGSVEALVKSFPPSDLVVLDPPRAGIKPMIVSAICRLAPRTIIYVSCDPTTLARDLKAFAAQGYQTEYVQPFDLFSQTYHIECVAKLTR